MINFDKPQYDEILSNPQSIANYIRRKSFDDEMWYFNHSHEFASINYSNWKERVLDVLYRRYLDIDIEKGDGVLIDSPDHLLIIDWQTYCPVLERCEEQGISTELVCGTLYHTQAQMLLSLILPGAIFRREYGNLRPKGKFCREILEYHSGDSMNS